LAVLGEWYAFRGRWAWAAELLESARSTGHATDRESALSLTLARCYWETGNLLAARREFERALARGEAPERYLRLCLAAVAPGGAPQWVLANPGDAAWSGDLKTAAGYYQRQVDSGSHSRAVWISSTLLRLAVDDLPGYHRHRLELRARFVDPATGIIDDDLPRFCLLAPGPDDPQRLLTVAEAALAKLEPWRIPDFPQIVQAVGLGHLRCGQWARAAAWFEAELRDERRCGPQLRHNQVLLAIALAHLGRTAEARGLLGEANAALSAYTPSTHPNGWGEWVIGRAFVSEAEAAIKDGAGANAARTR
jgi:tetratricopeptide (TPR) repeat protein